MKLAEALRLRADLQKRISQLDSRLMNNARVQEGEQPAEDPAQLLVEQEACYEEYEALVEKINRTNSATVLPEGSLTALLAKRDRLTRQLQGLRNFLNAASDIAGRASRSEIKIKSAVDVRALQKDVDRRSAQLRSLEGTIQAANWTTELME